MSGGRIAHGALACALLGLAAGTGCRIERDWLYRGGLDTVTLASGQRVMQIDIAIDIPEAARPDPRRVTTDSLILDLRGAPRMEATIAVSGRRAADPVRRGPAEFQIERLLQLCPEEGDCALDVAAALTRDSDEELEAGLYLEYFVAVEERGVVRAPDDDLVGFTVLVDGAPFTWGP